MDDPVETELEFISSKKLERINELKERSLKESRKQRNRDSKKTVNRGSKEEAVNRDGKQKSKQKHKMQKIGHQ